MHDHVGQDVAEDHEAADAEQQEPHDVRQGQNDLGAQGAAEQEPAAPDTTPGRLELRAALQALPPGYRAVVHLYYYAGYTPQEIAAALGLTRSGVYMRLTRARRLLGDFLKEGSP